MPSGSFSWVRLETGNHFYKQSNNHKRFNKLNIWFNSYMIQRESIDIIIFIIYLFFISWSKLFQIYYFSLKKMVPFSWVCFLPPLPPCSSNAIFPVCSLILKIKILFGRGENVYKAGEIHIVYITTITLKEIGRFSSKDEKITKYISQSHKSLLTKWWITPQTGHALSWTHRA